MDKEAVSNLKKENQLYWFSVQQDKCLPCKLFSAPLFFFIGGYMAFRNR